MSNIYHAVTLPDTGDVITVRHWNEQFVDNWNYVGNMTVGDRYLADIGVASPEPFGAMVWIAGAAYYSNFMDETIAISYPANTRHLRIIATGLRSNHTTDDTFWIVPNADTTAGNYDKAIRTETGTGLNFSEYFGNFAGFDGGVVPGVDSAADVASCSDMTIYLPSYGGAVDMTHYQTRSVWNAKATGKFRGEYPWGRWRAYAAITSLMLTLYTGNTFLVGGTGQPPMARIDVYAILGG